MKSALWLALLAALCTANPAAGQAANASPPQQCELHFWPASRISTNPDPIRAQGGLVWALALGGAERALALVSIRSDMTSHLDADGAAIALGKSDLAARLALENATLIVHQLPLGDKGLNSIRTRRSGSKSPCYAELIVASMDYQAGGFNGQSLRSSFFYREFGSSDVATYVVGGSGTTSLDIFPNTEGEDAEPGLNNLSEAFRQNFEKFAAKLKQR